MRKQILRVIVMMLVTLLVISVLAVFITFQKESKTDSSKESTTPYEGIILYSVSEWHSDQWGSRLGFRGKLVAWIQEEGEGFNVTGYVYILDIADPENPSLIRKEPLEDYWRAIGPLVLSNDVVWYENYTFYVFNITTNETKVLDLDNSALGIPHYLVTARKSLNLIKIYNLSDGSVIEISSRADYLSFSDFYLIWGEKEEYPSNSTYNYSIWSYDRISGSITKLLDNITLTPHTYGTPINIFEDKIVYCNGSGVFLFNVTSGKIWGIAENNNSNETNQLYVWNPQIYEDKVIYIESSSIYGGYYNNNESLIKYWCVDISTGKKVELKTAFCIHENRVVGITVDGDNKLYLFDLKELF